MNPNHPHYGLGSGGPNLNILDNMLMAAGFQATDQPIVPKPTIVPQYTYAQDPVSMHHHAMNLVQPHSASATSASADPVHVIVYQNEAQQQQQPISYKIPQLGTVVQQDQAFVVNEQAGQISREQTTSTTTLSRQLQAPVTAHYSSSSLARANILTQSVVSNSHVGLHSDITRVTKHVQSPAERKKDIVAQAMQEQKIFEDSLPKQEPVVKQEPGVATPITTLSSNITIPSPLLQPPPLLPGLPPKSDTKPVITTTPTPTKVMTPTPPKRPYQRTNTVNRQQVMPRIQILEDEDDGLTCRLCLASYWYKTEIHEHLKTVHSITDPDKYDKEEKEKKMRRLKEDQQRSSLAKKQREERERKLREAKFGKSRGGTIKLTSPGARPQQTSPGARPSFQYRDGAFICDLCKESFSDGNDMVTHWKSHVKKQQAESKSLAVSSPRGRGRGRGRGGGRGRPPMSRRDSSDSNDRGKRRVKRETSSDDEEDKTASSSGKRGKRGDKGKPRWTAYLLWSTRKRRDVVVDHPDWTFAQIAKWISDEWKKIESDEKDELQKEAEEMNELGIRKLPRDDDGPDPEKDTTDEDSDFEEGYRKKSKPIMLKIKKEKKREKKEKGERDSGAVDGSDESDWEPMAEVLPPEREQTRSGRQRKRPSFFQEFESQENNLDSILQEFEETQAKEFGKPRVPKPTPKPATERKPRKRKAKEPQVQSEDQPVEVETLRSGRKRKVRRMMANFMDEEDEDEKLRRGASSDDDDFEPPPEEEVEKIEEHDDQIEEDEEEEEFDDGDDDDEGERRGDEALPPKKRGRPKKILTDAEIEEATRAAIVGTKPVIEITRVPKAVEVNGALEPGEVVLPKAAVLKSITEDTEQPLVTAKKSAPEPQSEIEGFKPMFVNETLESEGEDEARGEKEKNPLEEDKNPLEGGHNINPSINEATEVSDILSADVQVPPMNEEDALLATATTEPPQFTVTECGVQSNEVQMTSSETDKNDVSQLELGQPDHFTGQQAPPVEAGEGPSAAPLSEEDLLTGPAHNLDDSVYKTDYVDTNLDDIFK